MTTQDIAKPSWLNRIARVLLCLVFVNAVLGKVTGFGTVAGVIAAKGLPLAPLLLVAAMALMAVGSALVISGWRARLGVVLLLLFLIPTTLLFHGDERHDAAHPAAQEPGDHRRPAARGRPGEQSRSVNSQNREIFRAALQPFPETGEYPSGFDSSTSFCKDSQGVAKG